MAETPSNHQMEIVVEKTWHTSALRDDEVRALLRKLNHKNVVRILYSYQRQYEGHLLGVFLFGLVYECLPSNLHQFLKEQNRCIDIVEVKMITWQLFRGQAHLQEENICHRDIKPHNLLFDAASGHLKISGFGSAIQAPRTTQHVTRCYRPPELLLGSRYYGSEIDIWSCGCVFGELLKGGIFLAGKTDFNQAEIVFDALGLPSKEEMSAMNVDSDECGFNNIVRRYAPDPLRQTADFTYLYKQTTANQKDSRTSVFNEKIGPVEMRQAVEILRQILKYNPKDRLAGRELLTQPFFADLFQPRTRRKDNRAIGCLTKTDLNNVKRGTTVCISTD